MLVSMITVETFVSHASIVFAQNTSLKIFLLFRKDYCDTAVSKYIVHTKQSVSAIRKIGLPGERMLVANIPHTLPIY